MNFELPILYIVFHGLSAFLPSLLVVAIFKRMAAGKNLKMLLFAVLVTSISVIVYHLNLTVTGIYILSSKGSPLVLTESNGAAGINTAWCSISAMTDLFASTGIISGACCITILMFATLSRGSTFKPLLYERYSRVVKLAVGLFTYLVPAIFSICYLIIIAASSHPMSSFKINYWYCTFNPSISPALSYSLAAALITMGSLIAITFGVVTFNLIRFRALVLEQMGKSDFPEDYIMRSFQIGFFASLVAILTGVDLILNVKQEAQIGLMNSIPVYLMLQNSIIGCGFFQNWGTVDDLVPYIPLLSQKMKKVQGMMKNATVKTTAGASKGSKSSKEAGAGGVPETPGTVVSIWGKE